MRRSTWIGLASATVLGLATPALADWKGKGELGASFASGNSENEAVNGSIEVKNTRDEWTHTLGAAGSYGSDGSVTTAERWEFRAQSDYTFNERAYWFGAGRYEDDRFSAFDYQTSLSTGLGYRIINTERTKFWIQGGPGFRFAKLRDTGESTDGVIFRLRPSG